MAICGHQFRGGDESDWVLSVSVGCLDGSTTASRILQELFKKHCRSMPSGTSRKRPKALVAAASENTHLRKPRPSPPSKDDRPEGTLIVQKIPGLRYFENFDESQHLNGCPMKWLYHRKLLEKNKKFMMGRLCSKRAPQREETKRERRTNVRDKTPVEVKIHKINLMEKYGGKCEDLRASGDAEDQPGDVEARRRKLAAKLNWKLHDESPDEGSFETVSEMGLRHDYFPPRPLLGLRPLLPVPFSDTRETNCCSFITPQLPSTNPARKRHGASLSIHSLHFPSPPAEPRLRPKTTSAPRWGSKSCVHAKKLQVPNQITLKVEQKKRGGKSPEAASHSLPVKRASEKPKQAKSLSSLFYELRGKTSCRTSQSEDDFEELIRGLSMEGQFKMKRFLNLGQENRDVEIRGGKSAEEETGGVTGELNLVCGKVRFFSKKYTRKRVDHEEV